MSEQKDYYGKIEKIETEYPIYCPFCEQLVRDEDEDGEYFYEPNVCEHLLFSACDDGFEFRSKRFNEHMGIEPNNDDSYDEFWPEGKHIDEFTDEVCIPGSIKYANYGPFATLGAYYGFAPTETVEKK